MYLVTAKTKATAQDFPGSTVEWAVGQTREVHDSLIQEFKNNPAAWTVSGGATTSTVTATPSAQGGAIISSGDSKLALLQSKSLYRGKQIAPAGRKGIALLGPEVNYTAPAPSVGAQCTIGSSGFATVDGEKYFQVTASFTAGSGNWFEIAAPYQQQPFSSESLQVEFQASDPANVQKIVAYMGTNSFAQSVSAEKAIGFAGSGSSPHIHKGRLAFTFAPTDWTKNSFTEATRQKAWTSAKLRIYANAGVTLTFWLRSMQAGVASKRARLAVTLDDGHKSVFRMGVPMLRSFGVCSSLAVVPSVVDTLWYLASMDDLKAYVAEGNICFPHGPGLNVTNLFDAPYASTADRLADMVSARDWLVANKLVSGPEANCYAWPQGKYASAAGEADLLDAMMDAGFKVGRCAVVADSTRAQYLRGLSPRSHQRLTLPIIGHQYAGAKATANDAAETTNVAAICTQLDTLAAIGGDATLMLHKFVPAGGTTSGAGAVEIEMDRLETILTKIVALRDAGSLDDVLLSDFAA